MIKYIQISTKKYKQVLKNCFGEYNKIGMCMLLFGGLFTIVFEAHGMLRMGVRSAPQERAMQFLMRPFRLNQVNGASSRFYGLKFHPDEPSEDIESGEKKLGKIVPGVAGIQKLGSLATCLCPRGTSRVGTNWGPLLEKIEKYRSQFERDQPKILNGAYAQHVVDVLCLLRLAEFRRESLERRESDKAHRYENMVVDLLQRRINDPVYCLLNEEGASTKRAADQPANELHNLLGHCMRYVQDVSLDKSSKKNCSPTNGC